MTLESDFIGPEDPEKFAASIVKEKVDVGRLVKAVLQKLIKKNSWETQDVHQMVSNAPIDKTEY